MAERVMVCMSSNTLAPRVLRTGARIAAGLGEMVRRLRRNAKEKPGHITSSRRRQHCIRTSSSQRASALCGRVRADRPSDGLVAFAQREGVTHVIFARLHVPAGRRCGVVRRGQVP